MLDLTVSRIEKMVDDQLRSKGSPPGFPEQLELPSARYYDPGFAALEQEHLWAKSWLAAGHASELKEPGSYKLFEHLGRSVIVARGNDGEVRAMHNVCRHRGSALVLEPKGRTPRFVCPYHGWSYGLNGQLLAITEPQEFPCMDKATKPLVPVRCEIWRGMIFINFDPKAMPLAEFMEPLARQLGPFPLEQFVVKGPNVYKLDCNWNAARDNTLETYHVKILHPVTLAPFLDGPSFNVGLLKHGHSRHITRKKAPSTIFTPEERVENVAGPMFERYNICLAIFPNSYLVLDPGGFVMHSYWPDGPSRCLVEFIQFGLPEVSEEVFRRMLPTMEHVLGEDWRLFGRLQRAMETGASRSMPIGYQERAIYWQQEQIDRTIGQERIPEALRVPLLLEPFSEQ